MEIRAYKFNKIVNCQSNTENLNRVLALVIEKLWIIFSLIVLHKFEVCDSVYIENLIVTHQRKKRILLLCTIISATATESTSLELPEERTLINPLGFKCKHEWKVQ